MDTGAPEIHHSLIRLYMPGSDGIIGNRWNKPADAVACFAGGLPAWLAEEPSACSRLPMHPDAWGPWIFRPGPNQRGIRGIFPVRERYL